MPSVISPILPGQTLGILGSGQLGRMLAIAARQMGYQVAVYSPDADSPTAPVADHVVVADYDDITALAAFGRQVDVVTVEFENIPASALKTLAEQVPVRPAPQVLFITQHRLREKQFLQDAGFPVVPFAPVDTAEDIAPALARVGTPAVLKTAGFGYDGKGQAKVTDSEAAHAAWTALGQQSAILEAFISFSHELSVLVARNPAGQMQTFPVAENMHARHILDVSVVPAPVSPDVAAAAEKTACAVAESLQLEGLLCVEFFLTPDGTLYINELAPRPHNSGHYTLNACVTSQFEQQLRAICALPLGETRLLSPCAMANLMGEHWQPNPPDWEALCAYPAVKLHLYGKTQARPGRKMGHLTALSATPEKAKQLVIAARNAATRQMETSPR